MKMASYWVQRILILLLCILQVKALDQCKIHLLPGAIVLCNVPTPLCSGSPKQGYAITIYTQGQESSKSMLTCWCHEGQPQCSPKNGYKSSTAGVNLTVNIYPCDEGIYVCESVSPIQQEVSRCTLELTAEDIQASMRELVPSTTSTTPTTASTTVSTTSTQDSSNESNTGSLWAAIAALISVVVVLAVAFIVVVMCLLKKLKETVKENSNLKAQLQEPSSNNPDISVITSEEVQSIRIPIPASTNDTTEELHAESAERQPNNGNMDMNRHYQLPVPVAGASHVLPAATSSQPSAHCVPNHAYSVHGSHASTSVSSVMPDQEEYIPDDSQSEDNTLLTDAVKTRPEGQQAEGPYSTFSYSQETDF